jgi:alcohol dehydrogenase class IV
MSFTFHTPTKIHFGLNEFKNLGKIASNFGQRCLIVTGRTSMKKYGYLDEAKKMLESFSIKTFIFDDISNDAKSSEVNRGSEICKKEKIDFIVALGGGSAIDGAKAISVTFDLKSVEALIGVELKQNKKSLPLIAIPTTAGTGSEVTKGAIITDVKKKFKSGVRGTQIFPDIAIIDPILSMTMTNEVAATTGFDAFTHLFESYLAKKSNMLTDMISINGLKIILKYLPDSLKDPKNKDFRSKISYAALLGGINVGNASTCLPHRLQQAIGSVPSIHQPHAMGLAAIYPAWAKEVYQYRSEKIETLKIHLGKKNKEIDFIEEFIEKIGVKNKLSSYNVKKNDINIFIKNISGNLENDPIKFKDKKLFEKIYQDSF